MAHAQETGFTSAAIIGSDDALRALRDVPGVDAVYQGDDGRVVYVIAREHGDVNWEHLLGLEERLSPGVHLTVRAHQERDPREMFPDLHPVY